MIGTHVTGRHRSGTPTRRRRHHPVQRPLWAHVDAVERHGGNVADARVHTSQWTIVADDPERVWAQVGEHAMYELNKYIEWGSFEGPDQPSPYSDAQAVLDAGAFRLMDAAMAVDELVALAASTFEHARRLRC